MEVGHVQQNCKSSVDRRTLCYRCGQPGQIAQVCTAVVPKCAVCADTGKPAEHRAGGKACQMVRGGVKKPPTKAGPATGTRVVATIEGSKRGPQVQGSPDRQEEGRENKRMRIGKAMATYESSNMEEVVEDLAKE